MEKEKTYCHHCGTSIDKGSHYCPVCGANQDPNVNKERKPFEFSKEDTQNSLGVSSLVFSLVGLLLFYIPFAPIGLGIAGIALAKRNESRYSKAGKTIGIISIVLGGIALFAWAFYIIYLVVKMANPC